MVDDRTEEEQVEALKKWFAENGTSLVVSIVVILAVVFGYRSWQTNTRETIEAASEIYENLQEAMKVQTLETLSEEKIATGRFLADQLKTEYNDSTYAHFAAMHLAKLAVDGDDLDAAASELQWILDNGVEEKLEVIVNLRLAKVKLAQKEYEPALKLLDSLDPGGHRSSYDELRGDIFFAMDNMLEAREAYQRAVDAQGDTAKPLTKMKLQDLVAPESTTIEKSGEDKLQDSEEVEQ